ncbi:unnamed protein product [Bemisia tabaci]|uniref:G-protein coupled receptors family 1 profile domain-containing protein n=1 Tax=Bemisia tabaci TaxID=7038 RepID=A0A9P0AKT7_BEMTA|nr:unnamed protein product [Bemisia tabaci]
MDGLAFYNSSSYEDPFDTQNETLEQLLNRLRGPKHLPLEIVLPITIVYVSIFLTGVAGNLAVCLVIVRNSSMHTATNYYLFNLAVSDLTLLLLVDYQVASQIGGQLGRLGPKRLEYIKLGLICVTHQFFRRGNLGFRFGFGEFGNRGGDISAPLRRR